MKNPMKFWKFILVDIYEQEEKTGKKTRFDSYYKNRLRIGWLSVSVSLKKMRQLVEFRTPQHPSLGKNNWGGASPLLARNIPHETLELRYLKLNSARTRDEIFPLLDDDDDNASYYLPVSYTARLQRLEKSRYVKGSSFLSKLSLPWKRKKTLLGSSSGKKWFKIWDYQNRWPQGWC